MEDRAWKDYEGGNRLILIHPFESLLIAAPNTLLASSSSAASLRYSGLSRHVALIQMVPAFPLARGDGMGADLVGSVGFFSVVMQCAPVVRVIVHHCTLG